jgi:hypothetical protein
MRHRNNKGFGILALAFLAAGVVVLYFGVQIIRNGFASRNWPDTPGTIQSTAIQTKTNRTSGGKSKTSYTAKITYRYEVSGKSYSNSTIGFGKSQYSSSKKSKTEKYLGQYPQGKQVAVYFDPQNPGKAVLEAGFTAGAFLINAAGVFFVAIGFVSLVARRKNRHRLSIRHLSII